MKVRGRPYVQFSQIKQNVSLPEVLHVLGIFDDFVQRGNRLSGVCPMPSHLHGPNPRPDQWQGHLHKDGYWLWKCFSPHCGQGGDVLSFVQKYLGFKDLNDAKWWFVEHFAERLDLTPPARDPPTKKAAAAARALTSKAATPALNGSEADFPLCVECGKVNPLNAAHCYDCGRVLKNSKIQTGPQQLKPLRFFLRLEPTSYLDERGVSARTQERYGLGLCSKGMFAGYVVAPIHHRIDGGWQVVAYIGRWPAEPDSAHPRYKLPSAFPKGEVLFGLKQALGEQERVSDLIVCEGPFSLFAIVQAGFSQAVACLGSTLTAEQTELLLAATDHVTLAFDGDAAGQAGHEQAVRLLNDRCFVRCVTLPEGTQPDHFSAKQLNDLFSFLRKRSTP